MTRRSRTWLASLLLAGVLALLLGAWFLAGWSQVRTQQAATREAPVQAAEAQAAAVVAQLRTELAALIAREVERPYFHYQNLMRDPRASRAAGVTPSPLASATHDELVRGYFQLDPRGRASTPTLNDDVPALSEQTRLAEHTQFRDEVARSLAPALATGEPPPIVAAAPAPPRPVRRARPPAQQAQQAQVITLDRDSYQQNSFSNSIYQEQAPAPEPVKAAPRVVRPAPEPVAADPVTIVVSPLEWRTLPLEDAPALVAVRRVDTPDGRLTQGFVVDRGALAERVEAPSADAVLALRSGDTAADARHTIAPGWTVDVAVPMSAIMAAEGAAITHATTFLMQFGVVAVLALLAAVLVLWMVARAERLARERSQFAAAAAHELRTPLAGLQLYGDMLASGLGDPDKHRDYARRMSEEAARLGRVVSNVLGFSQLERGNLSVEARVDRIDEALRELAERIEPTLDRAGCVLALEVEPGLTARFDRDALARIVGNLLDNAEKYSRGADDRTITLAARAVGDDAVEIAVSDHGPGIPASVRSSLFRPFKRGTDPDAPAGLGLGLVLSRSLARAMMGDLTIRADGERGATFVLRLVRAHS